MRISANGLKLIERFESCVLTPYSDEGGYSVGYGHRLEEGASLAPISQGQAELYLESDVASAEHCINLYVTVPLTQNQFDALCDFVYELGCGSLETSTLLTMLNAGNIAGAADQLLRWDYAGGTPVASIENRRKVEQTLFMTPDA